LIGTRQYRRMESSCASTPPAREPENIEAAKKARERETNAPCWKKTAENTWTRETNMSERKTAATRRDGEPLTSAAQEQRQEETVAAEHQAAGESSSPSQERTVAKDVRHQVCSDPGAGD
jgi:hypothetical protein